MNDTKKLDVQTCIDGLKEIVLDVLVEPKRKGEWVRTSNVKREVGIIGHLVAVDPKEDFRSFFIRALLFKLKEDVRVLGEEKGPIVKGKPSILWQLTDAEFQKHQMDATQKLDLETCIDGLYDHIFDVLVEAKEKEKEGDMGLKVITERTGILEQLEVPGDYKLPSNFTYALLMSLRNHGCVEKNGHGYYAFWTVTDRIFQIHQKRRT